MPTYSYECRKCGQVQPVFHPMNASPRVKCPACGASCKRLLGTGAGILFKGSGFYETDYRRKVGKSKEASDAAQKKDKGETKSESKSESRSESKSESKPESKPETKTGAKASTET